MFPTLIESSVSALTSPIADTMFPNITGRAFRGDYSFSATLRALLYNRMPENHRMSVWFNDNVPRIDVGMNYQSAREFLNNSIGHVPENEIAVVNLRNRGEASKPQLEFFETQLAESVFTYEPDLSLAMEQTKLHNHFGCRVFTSKANNAAIVVVDSLDTLVWHTMQAILCRLLVNYYDRTPEGKPNDMQMRVVLGLNCKDGPEKYIAALKEIENVLDFRGMSIRAICKGTMKRSVEARMRKTEEELNNFHRRIDDIMTDYKSCIRQMEELNIVLAGCIAQKNAAANDDELIEYLTSQTWFNPIEKKDDGFSFILRSDLDLFDAEMYECMIDNDDSFYWDDVSYNDELWEDEDDRRLLLDHLFGSEADLKLQTCAFFTLGTAGNISSWSGYSYPAAYENCLPNPHLNHFNCLGAHFELITDRIRAGDLIGAIAQCRTSTASVNLGESPTMRHFLEDLWFTHKTCIRLPDGREVEPHDALLYLKGELNNA